MVSQDTVTFITFVKFFEKRTARLLPVFIQMPMLKKGSCYFEMLTGGCEDMYPAMVPKNNMLMSVELW